MSDFDSRMEEMTAKRQLKAREELKRMAESDQFPEAEIKLSWLEKINLKLRTFLTGF